jgi:hypothetical protein
VEYCNVDELGPPKRGALGGLSALRMALYRGLRVNVVASYICTVESQNLESTSRNKSVIQCQYRGELCCVNSVQVIGLTLFGRLYILN